MALAAPVTRSRAWEVCLRRMNTCASRNADIAASSPASACSAAVTARSPAVHARAGFTDPAEHHRGGLIDLRPQRADRDGIGLGAGPRGGFHPPDQARQDPARLLVAGRLVAAVHPLHVQPQPRQVRGMNGAVGPDHRFQGVIGHHRPLDLAGRRVLGRPRITRLVAGQLADINAEDLREGDQDAVAVDLAQAALDLGQPAFRPAS